MLCHAHTRRRRPIGYLAWLRIRLVHRARTSVAFPFRASSTLTVKTFFDCDCDYRKRTEVIIGAVWRCRAVCLQYPLDSYSDILHTADRFRACVRVHRVDRGHIVSIQGSLCVTRTSRLARK